MRRRSWLAAIAAVVALLAAPIAWPSAQSSAPAHAPDRSAWRPGDPVFHPPGRTPRIVGVNYHGMWDDMTPSVRSAVLDDLAAAGVRWVRLDVSWADLQPDGPDSYDVDGGVAEIEQRLDEIAARGMKTLLLLYWAPAWATGTSAKNGVPRDPDEFGRAAAWAAERWRDRIHAIELWNEPDLDTFLANRSPATYTALVKAAYPRIKAVNPELTVVAGAPTYVRTSWYEEFYRLGGAGHYDALGIHPYVGMSDQPPTACEEAFLENYPCNVPNLIRLMQANGDGDKKLWATEYGWSSSGLQDGVSNWRRGVDEDTQADHLLQMQAYLAQWPQVEATFWYTDRDTARSDPHEDNFGLLTRDLTRKPAYYALRCAAARVCGPDDGRLSAGMVVGG